MLILASVKVSAQELPIWLLKKLSRMFWETKPKLTLVPRVTALYKMIATYNAEPQMRQNLGFVTRVTELYKTHLRFTSKNMVGKARLCSRETRFEGDTPLLHLK